MRFLAFGLVVLLLALVGRVAMVLIPIAGFFRDLPETDLSACEAVTIAPGTEDVDIDPVLNVAFISAADRRTQNGLSDKNGIYAMALDGSKSIRRVSPDGFGPFAPHGISLWRSKDGDARLFVINHQPTSGGTTRQIVEIFDIKSDASLSHLQSVSFPEMYSPNDVVGVSATQFYATNDRRFRDGLGALAELYLGLPLADVAYWNGSAGSIAAKHFVYTNGINVSHDGGTVYVAELLNQTVHAYDRDAATGALSHKKAYPVDTNPDNLDIDQNGLIWIGGHPKALEFQAHAADPAVISPSQVMTLDPASGATETVLTALKGELNGSATGAVWDDTLIVGAVFEDRVLVCDL